MHFVADGIAHAQTREKETQKKAPGSNLNCEAPLTPFRLLFSGN